MFNKKNLTTIFFITISLLLAIVARYYQLGKAPAGLYLDEAAQGYNAYSILKTGKDEFSKVFPVVFRSFTDFKTPVYIYLIIPLIPIFGLTAFTVRFPSFIFSILSIPLIYLLTKQIFPAKKGGSIAMVTSLLLSISPWHILFGRTNFECNVALFFFLLGLYLFYQALPAGRQASKKPFFLIFSAIAFAVAIPSYHSQRIITPLMLVILFIKYRQILLSQAYRKFLIIGLFIGLLILLPTLSVATTPGFLARAAGLNIFSHPNGYINNLKGVTNFLVNNSLFLSTKEFFSLYLSYLAPRSMFILGDSGPRSSFPGLSTFYLWQFPFYIYGLYLLIKDKRYKNLKFFTLSLLFISPLPAAVTRDPYSTIRSLPLVIPQLLIISLGLVDIYDKIKKRLYRAIALLILTGLILYSLVKLYSSVIILNEYYRPREWNYGWQQVVETIKTLDSKLPVIVDNTRSEPYNQLLFFLDFDPATYQKENFEVPLNEYYTNMNRNKEKTIGNITTRPINWEKDLTREQYLIGDELSISKDQIQRHNLTLIKEIYYPDGSPAFLIVKTNP